MSQYFSLHPVNPQLRLIRRAVEILRDGGVVVYPTDSCYALGCHLGDKDAMERIRRIRHADKDHNFTLVCRDLSEIATYAKVDNPTFRLLKAYTPGPYTFILEASREVPRRLQHPKRKTIGIRVPDHPVPLAMLAELGEPIMSSTLMLPGDDAPLTDPEEMRARLEHQVDLIMDGGPCGFEATTVVDLTGEQPRVLRAGRGDPTPFGG
jgi:tRNA threonylcarbamoyl adenosine modification protein (Sua5/YciO/YrdC/YwlC family)